MACPSLNGSEDSTFVKTKTRGDQLKELQYTPEKHEITMNFWNHLKFKRIIIMKKYSWIEKWILIYVS